MRVIGPLVLAVSTAFRPVISSKSIKPKVKTSDLSVMLPDSVYSGAKKQDVPMLKPTLGWNPTKPVSVHRVREKSHKVSDHMNLICSIQERVISTKVTSGDHSICSSPQWLWGLASLVFSSTFKKMKKELDLLGNIIRMRNRPQSKATEVLATPSVQ